MKARIFFCFMALVLVSGVILPAFVLGRSSHSNEPNEAQSQLVASQESASDNSPVFFVAGAGNNIYLYPSNGDGTFATAILVNSMGSEVVGGAIDDFNSDGLLDIVANDRNGTCILYLNQGSSSFERDTIATNLPYPSTGTLFSRPACSGDFNNDDLPDFIILTHGQLCLFTNQGSNDFVMSTDDVTSSCWSGGLDLENIQDVDVGDFDENGNLDFVLMHYWNSSSNEMCLYLGNGNGTFYHLGSLPTANPGCSGQGGSCSVIVGDFNGDGHDDLVQGLDDDGDPGQTWLWLGDGSGNFSKVGEAFDTDPNHESDCDAGSGYGDAYDFDGDGTLDIICRFDIELSFFKGDTTSITWFREEVVIDPGIYGSGYLLSSPPVSFQPGTAIALYSPPNGSHVTVAPTFQWYGVSGATYYQVLLASDTALSEIVWSKTVSSSEPVPYDGSTVLENGQTYWWSVRAMIDWTWGDYVSPWNFVKESGGTPLPAPVLNTPLSGSDVALPETFSWFEVDSALQYQVVLSSDSTFSFLLWSGFSNTGYLQVPVNISGVTDESTYYWRARAIDDDRNPGDYSEIFSFTKAASVAPPIAPALLQPIKGDTVNSQPVVFSWDQSNRATSYTLAYSISEDFTPNSNETWTIPGITSTAYPVTLFPSATMIYWKIAAVNNGGNSGWSIVDSFYYDYDPQIPVSSITITCPPTNGQQVIVGDPFIAKALITGTHSGSIGGNWLIDGSVWEPFSAQMQSGELLVITSPLLPTSEVGSDTIEVQVTAPNFVSSNQKFYYTVEQAFDSAVNLEIETSTPPPYIADDSMKVVLLASVLDSLDHVVLDASQNIYFTIVGGSGVLAYDSINAIDGVATDTLTLGAEPGSTTVEVTSEGLKGDSLSIYAFSDQIAGLRSLALLLADSLSNLELFGHYYDIGLDRSTNGYNTDEVVHFVTARIDSASPVAEED